MLILDLRWLILIGAVILIGLPMLTLWLYQLRHRQQHNILPVNQTLVEIFDQSPFGYLVLAAEDTHYQFANLYACRLLGLAQQTDQLPSEDWTQALQEDCQVARRGFEQAGVDRQVTLPNNRYAHWWIFPAERLDVVFLLDITAQRQANQQARLLLGGLSHELRTPIATILTHLEVLAVPNLTQEVEDQSLHLLKQEAGRMSKMVNQLLLLGRLELEDPSEHRPLHIDSLVKDVITQITSSAQAKNLTLSFEVDTPLPPIAGDEDRLKQVFLNLLDNAIKYAQTGDSIEVTLQRDHKGVMCVITDSGPGIPAEHLPHLTRHFYRVTAQEAEGSGLGLAIVSEILRQHHSHLEIASPIYDNKTGSRFSFIIPAIPKKDGEPS